jgi:CubicO group peptidase (beta-lactamase class C family)
MHYWKQFLGLTILVALLPLNLACIPDQPIANSPKAAVDTSLKVAKRLSARNYWPLERWRESIAEEQGMDSKQLSRLQQHTEHDLPHIRSIVVIRHGYQVFAYYRPGIGRDDLHEIASITKSVTSALIGAALKNRILKTVDQKIIGFFSEYDSPQLDPQVRNITLKHLLTMTAGFNWDDRDFSWLRNEDLSKFAIERRVSHQPGTIFNYDTPASHLLSAILSKSTRMSAMAFADKYLFGPLGIVARQWPAGRQGHNYGGHGLRLTTQDLAKLGYLYLNLGFWDGRQVILEDFVRASTHTQNHGGPPERVNYGYLWWVSEDAGFAVYFAGGFGGQFLYVVPELDFVVAMNSDLDRAHRKNRAIVGRFIIPAILK